ncbi:MAG: nucleoside-diphosphate sugar epimerase [Marivirga sp.]|nr:nucleoside-diphosphate sugar epimerase [Marivirga sp.]
MDDSSVTFMEERNKPVILITGASGLIGSRLIKKLADNYQCIGLDKAGNPKAHIRSENICFDITDPLSIDAALQRIQFAYGDEIASVVHLAAYYDFAGEPSDLYEKVTVRGTENFLAALQKLKVKQFIFSSTNLVYKPTEPGKKINEDWPLDPAWDYPKSKVETEDIIHKKRGKIPVVVLRLSGVYNEEGNSIPITNQIQRIYEKDLTSHFFPGDLLHGNAFIHLDDLDEAFVKTIEKRNDLPGEITINISESRTFSYEELQQTVGELIHGEEWKTFEIPKPLAKAGAWAQDVVGDPFIKPWMIDLADDHYEMDISKAKKYLDWQPRHDLMSTLPKIVNVLKSDPEKWYKSNKLNP